MKYKPRHCDACEKLIKKPKNSTQKYCGKCAKKKKDKYQKEYQKEYRENNKIKNILRRESEL